MGLYCSYYNSLVNSLSHSHDYLFFFHFLNLQLPFHLFTPKNLTLIHQKATRRELWHLTNKSIKFPAFVVLCFALPIIILDKLSLLLKSATCVLCANLGHLYKGLLLQLLFPSFLSSILPLQLDYFHQHTNIQYFILKNKTIKICVFDYIYIKPQ